MRERELTEESTFSNHNRADAFRLSTAFFSARAVLLVSLFAVLAYLQHAVLSLRVSDFEFRIRAYRPSGEIFTMSKNRRVDLAAQGKFMSARQDLALSSPRRIDPAAPTEGDQRIPK